MNKGMNRNTSVGTVRLIQEIGPDVDWKTRENKQFLAGVLSLENEDEAKRFFRDLMTPLEIEEFANRLEAASLLSSDMQYNYITEKTGLSSATIARIAKWLGGSLGGYRLILSRLSNSSEHRRLSKTSTGKGLSLRT